MSKTITRSELARQLGVSRTYVTLIAQGKRKPGQHLADKLNRIMLAHDLPLDMGNVLANVLVGKAGLEPARLAAHDPKSCLSANSSTPP